MSDAKILIVVEEAITAMDLQNRIKYWGYKNPVIVSSEKEAIQRALELKPDLAIIDIGLENCKDGIRVAGKIINELDTAVVYITPYIDEEMMRYIRATKPYGYISKPFEENQLKFTVEEALYKQRLHRRIVASK